MLEAAVVALCSAVEGLTEFLPISSSAHVMLVAKFFENISKDTLKSVLVYSQFGAISSVFSLYRKDIISMISAIFNTLRGHACDIEDKEQAVSIILACIPIVVIAPLVNEVVKGFLDSSPLCLPISLILLGMVMFIAGFLRPTTNKVDKGRALIVGISQILAIVPGMSRSGSTIVTALILGVAKEDAVRFSFLLGLPTIYLATLYHILKHGISDLTLAATSFAGGLIVALATAKFATQIISTSLGWKAISIYRIFLGITLLITGLSIA